MILRVRPFVPGDVGALAMLFHRSVREAGLRHYSAEQVQAWSPAPPAPESYLRRARERAVLVAVNGNDQPIGYGEFTPDGYVDHLYCHPDHVGHGVGSALLDNIDAAAIAAGIRELRVDASEGLRRLLGHRGFRLDARREFILHGVPIHNYQMSKPVR